MINIFCKNDFAETQPKKYFWLKYLVDMMACRYRLHFNELAVL
jgi:hypothetical protein